MIKKLITSFFILFCAVSFSQIGGNSVYQFLNLVTSPRQAALGGKVLTIYDNDVNQAQFNPATINAEMEIYMEKSPTEPLHTPIRMTVTYKRFTLE